VNALSSYQEKKSNNKKHKLYKRCSGGHQANLILEHLEKPNEIKCFVPGTHYFCLACEFNNKQEVRQSDFK